MFEDVAHLLQRSGTVETLFEGTVADDMMMFGEAVWRVRLLHPGEPTEPSDPRIRRLVEMVKEGDFADHPAFVPDKIRQRLTQEVA